MGLFRTSAKNDPPNVERRLWTLYLIKHKKKQPNLQEIQRNMEGRNPVLPKEDE